MTGLAGDHHAPSRLLTERGLRIILAGFAVAQLVTGIVIVTAPSLFHEWFANFGPKHPHLLRDVGTIYLATGVALAVSVRRPSWRQGAVGVLALQYAAHAVNHLVDVNNAEPAWVGPFDLAVQVAGTAILLWLLGQVAQEPPRARDS